MSAPVPTVKEMADDLSIATEVGGEFGYAHDEATDAIIIETYDDDGQIAKTYKATITIEEAI